MKHIKAKNKAQQSQQIDIAQKAKDLFGEETVHLVDED